jgi:hypothetical protein
MLSGCGGGSGGGATPAPAMAGDKQASTKPIAVGEQNGKPIDTAPFVKEAQAADCADIANRLFVIDNAYVLHTRSGRCGDNSYAHTLYGATPEKLLCSQSDSIAGPMTRCADESVRAMFDTIVKNIDQPGFGLGSTHEVKKVDFAQTASYSDLHRTQYSNVDTPQDIVIRDAETFNKIWEHVVGDQAPAPRMDFSRGMVLATFMGSKPHGCFHTKIDSVVREGGKLIVQIQDSLPTPEMMCTMAITTPAHLVAIDRSDEPVEFRRGEQLSDVDNSAQSGVHESKNVVIKDEATWATLWKQHAPHQDLPKIDFSTNMVLASFLGGGGGCDGVQVSSAVEHDGKLLVTRTETYPGPAMACIAVLTTPAHIVQVKRSDKPVEWVTRRVELPAPQLLQ